MSLAFNTRTTGMMPLEIVSSPNRSCSLRSLTTPLSHTLRSCPLGLTHSPCVRTRPASAVSTGIISEGFVDGKLWDLHTEVDVRPGTVGRSADRLFPSVELVCCECDRVPTVAPYQACALAAAVKSCSYRCLAAW